MAALAIVCRAVVCGLALGCAGARAAETELHAASRLICLNPAETREAVKAHRLIEPYAALKFAAEKRKGEALSAKLCHIGDEFIYEITLLHRDGRLVHVAIEAATGKLIPRAPREPHAPSIKN